MFNGANRKHDFWLNVPDDCKKAVAELKRLKVCRLLALDYEETFSDVWWLVLHEVDLYEEGEFCREASRSIFGEGDAQAMNLSQAKKADEWLVRWLDLFNKYKGKEYHSDYWYKVHTGWSDDDFYYGGQLI